MKSSTRTYAGDLGTVIDRTHECFDCWQREQVFAAAAGEEALERIRLAVHEWVANLVQHAEFNGRDAEVHVRVWLEGLHLCCEIKDNSEGFYWKAVARPGELERHIRTLPDRGMGLLLLQASTDELDYQREGNGCCRLQMRVRTEYVEPGGDSSTALLPPAAQMPLPDWQITLSRAG